MYTTLRSIKNYYYFQKLQVVVIWVPTLFLQAEPTFAMGGYTNEP